jgi:hypothetical protein
VRSQPSSLPLPLHKRLATALTGVLRRIERLDPGRWIPSRLRAHRVTFAAVLSVATLALLAVWQGREADRTYGAWDQFAKWDWLFLSAFATIIAGCWIARIQRRRFRQMVSRLVSRGVLVRTLPSGKRQPLSDEDGKRLLSTSAARSARFGHVAGIGTSAAALVWLYLQGMLANWSWLEGSRAWRALVVAAAWILIASAGYFVGRAIGELASYGLVRSPFLRGNVNVEVRPGHIDGAAGLKPIGWFYFTQALVAAIPAVFLAVWVALLYFVDIFENRYGPGNYANWRAIYIALIPIALSLQVLVFLRPLWSTHLEMREQRDTLLRDADRKAEQVRDLRSTLDRELDTDTRARRREQIADLERNYLMLEGMPTWPIDPALWRRFSWWLVVQASAVAATAVTDAVKLAV